jgi:hypothetical protein
MAGLLITTEFAVACRYGSLAVTRVPYESDAVY